MFIFWNSAFIFGKKSAHEKQKKKHLPGILPNELKSQAQHNNVFSAHGYAVKSRELLIHFV